MKYFTLAELTRSATAIQHGIDNTPSVDTIFNLNRLVADILDPLREAYGKPIHITSGYRSPTLNSAVGGVKTSHHQNGMAADFVGTPNTQAENKRLFELITRLKLPYTQLIHEKGSTATGPAWIHIGYNPADPRHQILYLK